MSLYVREFPYTDAMSKPKFLKRRLRNPKDDRKFRLFSWHQYAGSDEGGYWKKGMRPELDRFKEHAMYRLAELMWALNSDEPVYWLEGERDADSVHALGVAATSHWQGAANATPDQVERFVKHKSHIYLVADVDRAGAGCVIHRRQLLLGAGVDADRITLLAPPPPHSDATEAIQAGCVDLDKWVMGSQRLWRCERLAKRYLSDRPKPGSQRKRDSSAWDPSTWKPKSASRKRRAG